MQPTRGFFKPAGEGENDWGTLFGLNECELPGGTVDTCVCRVSCLEKILIGFEEIQPAIHANFAPSVREKPRGVNPAGRPVRGKCSKFKVHQLIPLGPLVSV